MFFLKRLDGGSAANFYNCWTYEREQIFSNHANIATLWHLKVCQFS